MQSNFSIAGKAVRESLFVPRVPMTAILQRSAQTTVRDRLRAIVATVVFGLGLGCAGVVGAKIYEGSHAWISGNKIAVTVNDFVLMEEPTRDDLARVVKSATFPIVFPVGLPSDSRVLDIMYSPAQHPNMIAISYKGQRSGFNANFLIISDAAINASAMPTGDQGVKLRGPILHWHVAKEVVALPMVDTHFSDDDVNRMKSAMADASASQSTLETQEMLPRIIAIGAAFRLEAAERLRAPSGPNVLLDWGELHHIADRVAHHEPVLDWRVHTISNVRLKNGVPDFSHVRPVSANVVAISLQGARAIDAVLTAANVYRPRCNCELLFNQPSAATYGMWLIPLTGKAATHYRVDASTMKVSQE